MMEKEIEILAGTGKNRLAFPFHCNDRQKAYRKDASLAQDEQEQKMLYLYVSKEMNVCWWRNSKSQQRKCWDFMYMVEWRFASSSTNHEVWNGTYFTIVFDEFQNFLKVNPAIPSIFRTFGIDTESTMVNLVVVEILDDDKI